MNPNLAYLSVQGPVPTGSGPYRLSGIQSAAWHAKSEEGGVVRREIRAVAAKRGVAIYDVDDGLLEPCPDPHRAP